MNSPGPLPLDRSLPQDSSAPGEVPAALLPPSPDASFAALVRERYLQSTAEDSPVRDDFHFPDPATPDVSAPIAGQGSRAPVRALATGDHSDGAEAPLQQLSPGSIRLGGGNPRLSRNPRFAHSKACSQQRGGDPAQIPAQPVETPGLAAADAPPGLPPNQPREDSERATHDTTQPTLLQTQWFFSTPPVRADAQLEATNTPGKGRISEQAQAPPSSERLQTLAAAPETRLTDPKPALEPDLGSAPRSQSLPAPIAPQVPDALSKDSAKASLASVGLITSTISSETSSAAATSVLAEIEPISQPARSDVPTVGTCSQPEEDRLPEAMLETRLLLDPVSNGTSLAKSSSPMKMAEKTIKSNPFAGQRLPGEIVSDVSAADAHTPHNPAIQAPEPGVTIPSSGVHSLSSWLVPVPADSFLASNSQSTADSSTSRSSADSLLHEISRNAIELKQLGAERADVILRPDSNTEISLHLSLRNGIVEVQARFERGDSSGLQTYWKELQHVLGQQNIHLSALDEFRSPVSPSAASPAPGFDGSSPDERNPRRESNYTGNPAEAALPVSALEATKPGRPATTSRLNPGHWESWA
jgi:hypothetical protein